MIRRPPGRVRIRIALAILAASALVHGARAATLWVGGCGTGINHPTIQAAVNAAAAGDAVSICPGAYNEAVIVSKNDLILASSTGNRADVTVRSANVVFTLAAARLTLRDMTVDSTNASAVADSGQGAGRHLFENLIIRAKNMGILLQQSSGGAHTFRNLEVTSGNFAGIRVTWNADGAHEFDGVTIDAHDRGIEVGQGAGRFRNVRVTAKGDAIHVGNKYPLTFDTVEVASENGQGIRIPSVTADVPDMRFSHVTVTAKDMGIHIGRAGKVRMDDITVESKDNAIHLNWDAQGAHELSNLRLISTHGAGLHAGHGLASVSDFEITAKTQGIHANSFFNASIRNGRITTSQDHGLYWRWGDNKGLTVADVTIRAGNHGILAERASSVMIQRVCVLQAVDGVRTNWQAYSVTVRDSRFQNFSGHGVNIQSDPTYRATVAHNAFLKASRPRAQSSSTAHRFDGNYWQGVAGGSTYVEGNVRDTSTLGADPAAACHPPGSPPPGASPPQAFNAVDADAHPVSGAIITKTAGQGFSLDIYALNAARTAVDTGFNGDVLVDLLANTITGVALDAGNCPVSGTPLAVGTVTLSAGRGSAAVAAVANVWRDVRVRLRYPATGPATVVACSSDNFAIKPATLAAVASDADWESPGTMRTLAAATATATPVHKAGAPFTLRLTGFNAGGSPTSQYDGSPAAQVACVLPASGCASLTTGAFSAAGGTLTSHTARYDEVGVIAATFIDSTFAAVDANDTPASCTGYHVCSGAVTIGRFVPDHFDVSANLAAFAPGCGSFTYLGQSFGWRTPLQLTVTAKNRAGAPTLNYTGGLWKLTPAGLTGQTWSAMTGTVEAVGSLPAHAVTELGAGQGRIDIGVGNPGAGGGLRFRRSGLATPFDASLNFSIHMADADGVTPTVHPYTRSGVGFDDGNPATSQDAQMRFGRLRLQNAHGSELLTLPVPMTSQYWNGQGFVTNGGDHCASLPAPTLTFFPQTANNQLASGETTASQNTPFVAGNGNLRLSAPGAGNYGYVDVGANAPEWLRYDWDGIDQGGDGALHDDNPRARATFGKRNSGGRLIIRREIY